MEKRIRNSIIYSFLTDDANIRNLIVLNAKSLVDDKEGKAVRIDEKRLKGELLYYRYYCENHKRGIYGLAPLICVIASNKNKKASADEAVQAISAYANAVFGSKHENMISAMLLSNAYHKILQKPGIDIEELAEYLKGEVAHISFECSGSMDIINVEKARIYSMQKLDRLLRGDIEGIGEKNPVDALLRVLHQIFIDDFEECDRELLSVKKALMGAAGIKIDEDPLNLGIENWKFLCSMADYVLKLREYSIGKEYIQEGGDPRNPVRLKKGELFADPIMGNAIVEDVFMSEGVLNVQIKAKAGKYVFKFKKK